MRSLQANSTLQSGKYKIINTLGQGGFGITYLAEQTMLERKVAIKEFFMKELCERNGQTTHVTLGTVVSRETVRRLREKFLKEAKNIAKLKHPNIVRIIDVFEENGTAYYVMEYCENGSLAEKIKDQGYMSEPIATRYIIQVAEALGYIHQQNMNHLDIKPSNIMLNEKNDVVLIDFGLSKQYNIGGQQTSTTPVGISEGYAPIEQHNQKGVSEFSPETDIYALGATFFKLLTGVTPPAADDVYEDGVPIDELNAKGVSQKAINVICKAMEPRKRDRMKDVRSFINELQGEFALIVQDDEEVTVPFQTIDDQRMSASVKKTEVKAEIEAKQEVECRACEAEEQCTCEKETTKKKGGIRSVIARLRQFDYKKVLVVILGCLLGGGMVVGIIAGLHAFGKIVKTISCKMDNYYYSKTYTVNGVSFDMMFVRGAEIPGKPGKSESVYLSSYLIGKTEVTQALWKAVMGNDVSQIASKHNWKTYGVGNDYPMYYVSWDDCQAFISKLNSLTGMSFRMPTEIEWWFADLGGIMQGENSYKWGCSTILDEIAWYSENSGGHTQPVAKKQPNELGINDMRGNVWEWCSNKYNAQSFLVDDSGETFDVVTDESSDSKRYYSCRGGGWDYNGKDDWNLTRMASDSCSNNVGLRLCISLLTDDVPASKNNSVQTNNP